MTRSNAPASAALLLLASCSIVDGDEDGGEPPADPPPCDLGQCPGPDQPFAFDTIGRIGVGTRAFLRYAIDPSLGDFTIVSDDPDVVAVEEVGDTIHIAGRGPGHATLHARSADGSLDLDQVTIRVVEVAAVQFYVRTPIIEPEPVDRVAGLDGSTDSLRVLYLAANGDALLGRSDFSASGSVQVREPEAVEGRLSEVFAPSQRVGLLFVEPGDGEVSADLGDGRSFSIPIAVVQQVPAIEVVTMVLRGDELVASDEVSVGNPMGADVVARRRDGTFILGVTAEWEVDPPVEYLVGPGPSTEIVFTLALPGDRDVTARIGSLSATHRISTP
jgi:hypothetical protein